MVVKIPHRIDTNILYFFMGASLIFLPLVFLTIILVSYRCSNQLEKTQTRQNERPKPPKLIQTSATNTSPKIEYKDECISAHIPDESSSITSEDLNRLYRLRGISTDIYNSPNISNNVSNLRTSIEDLKDPRKRKHIKIAIDARGCRHVYASGDETDPVWTSKHPQSICSEDGKGAGDGDSCTSCEDFLDRTNIRYAGGGEDLYVATVALSSFDEQEEIKIVEKNVKETQI